MAKAGAFPGGMWWLAHGPVAWDGHARLLAFCAEDGSGQVLWVVAKSGKVVARLPGPGIPAEGWAGREVLSWCPDGGRLAWVSAACRLFVLDVESGRVAGFPGDLGGRLVRLQGWSPDGSRLALLVSPGAGESWSLWLVGVPEAGGEGGAHPGAVVPQVWDAENLREVRWLAPDRLLALTADDRLLVLQVAG